MTKSRTNSQRHHWLDAWHVNPSSNREYDFIDGLRGIAILMVLCGHHVYINPESGRIEHLVGALAGVGGNGVRLFFALSGFLISLPFWKRKFARSAQPIPSGYASRRFWKIYPPLALSVIVFTPIYIFRNQDWSYLSLGALWLSGIPFLVPVSGKFNPVMWTLVVEVQFYIALALVFFCLKKASFKTSIWIITLLFLVIPVAYQAVTGLSANFYPDINSHFPSTMSTFYLGILVAALVNQGSLTQGWANLGWVGVALWPITLLLLAWLSRHPVYNSPTMQISCIWLENIASGCLLFFVASPQNPVVWMLCAPWLRWCGIISYEWYLFHQPIILWNRYFFGPAGGSVVKYVAIVGGSFLFSAALAAGIYRYFSLPILKYGRTHK